MTVISIYGENEQEPQIDLNVPRLKSPDRTMHVRIKVSDIPKDVEYIHVFVR